ncbi:phospholipase D family protein [Parasutterella excrementihominis]|uniref:phospholipase D family protein n=1 Tax=uncultured Parasutterella sp. TaxID=1263098 RepID=UPI002624FF89|nr:phospholipase D family protein [uncultured Parasutterella sp.]
MSKFISTNRKDFFVNLLRKTVRLDIASAFVSDCDLWKEILKSSNDEDLEVRLIAGVDGAISDPRVIGAKNPKIAVKVHNKVDGGIFHPKLYIFYTKNGDIEVLLGSANFTDGGFLHNDEILLHIKEEPRVIKQCIIYFEECWDPYYSREITPEELVTYTQKYKDRKKQSQSTEKVPEVLTEVRKKVLEDLKTVPADGSFLEYCSLLYQAVELKYTWLVDPENETLSSRVTEDRLFILLDTLEECHGLLTQFNKSYTPKDVHKIFGSSNPYAFLGNSSRSFLNTEFQEDTELAKRLRSLLVEFSKKRFQKNLTAKVETVHEILDSITPPKIGVAWGSRLLAIARPDLAISYNSASRDLLDKIVGCKSAKGNKEKKKSNYLRILQWLWKQDWYKNKPKELSPIQERIWNNRAALIDVLVYDLHLAESEKGPELKKLEGKILKFFGCQLF